MGFLGKIRALLHGGIGTSIEHQFAGQSTDGSLAPVDAADDQEFERLIEADEKLEARIAALAAPHLRTFATKYHQLVFADDYGNKNVDKWHKELGYFIDKVVMPDEDVTFLLAFSSVTKSPVFAGRDRLRFMLNTYIVGHNWDYVSALKDGAYDPLMEGADFERLVAAKLEKAGMRVSYTPATGDQGADLLAERGQERVAIQCKRSGTPVGNKAVQEAAAGRGYYGATAAWVISDAPFTMAAKQLAQRLDVSLLHHTELDNV